MSAATREEKVDNVKAARSEARILRAENRSLKRRILELQNQVMVDPLTGLGNRKKMNDSLWEHVADLTRGRQPLSVVVIDMDNLKPINDKGGHNAGDEALKSLANILKRSARHADVICRTGGDEFVAILPYTDQAGARIFIEKIQDQLSKGTVSASMGSATISGIMESDKIKEKAAYLIEHADAAMYRAKRAKRSTA